MVAGRLSAVEATLAGKALDGPVYGYTDMGIEKQMEATQMIIYGLRFGFALKLP